MINEEITRSFINSTSPITCFSGPKNGKLWGPTMKLEIWSHSSLFSRLSEVENSISGLFCTQNREKLERRKWRVFCWKNWINLDDLIPILLFFSKFPQIILGPHNFFFQSQKKAACYGIIGNLWEDVLYLIIHESADLLGKVHTIKWLCKPEVSEKNDIL